MIRINEENGNRILHDAYFEKKPNLMLLAAVRLVLLCVMSSSLCLLFTDLYGGGEKLTVVVCSVFFTAAVYILTSVLPSVGVYGGIAFFAAVFGYLFRKQIYATAVYFWNYMMLRLDSRLIHSSDFLVGNIARIRSGALDDEMKRAFFIASIVLCGILAIVFTLAGRTRFHISVPVTAAIVLISPAVMAETAAFYPSLIGFITGVFGLGAVSASYELDCGLVFANLFTAHNAVSQSERKYKKKTRLYSFSKKINGDIPRYQKYTANAVTMAVIAAGVFSAAAAAVPEGVGISYEEVFNAVGQAASSAADKIGEFFGTTFGRADDKGYFTHSSYGDISGSISLEPPGLSDLPVLQVSVGRNDIPVYLRGDIGVDFLGSGWSGVQESYKNFLNNKYTVNITNYAGVRSTQEMTLSDLLRNYTPETVYRAFRQYLAASGSDPDAVLPLQKVSVRYLRNTRVVFQPLAPYELDYRKNGYYDCYGDFILRSKSGFIKNHESLALTPALCVTGFKHRGKSASQVYSEAAAAAAWNGYSDDDYTQTEFKNLSGAYYDISRYVYGRLGEEESELIAPFTREIKASGALDGAANDFDTAMAVCDYFKQSFSYSLDTDNGEKPMETFLYETRTGHCALFATAATLVLRQLGVPARYVTGYVVSGSGTPSPVGYDYILTEKQLHAWVEVLLPETGWLAFDPTASVPGFAEIVYIPQEDDEPETTEPGQTDDPEKTDDPEAPDEQESSENEGENEKEGKDEPKEGENAGNGDNAGNEPPRGDPAQSGGEGGASAEGDDEDIFIGEEEPDIFPLLLPFITAAAVAAALAVIAWLFVRTVNGAERRVMTGFKKDDPTKATANMYRFTLKLLEKRGIVPGNEQFMDFAQRADKMLRSKLILSYFGINAFMADIVPIFEKCEFGDPAVSPITKEERSHVFAFVSSVYTGMMARKGRLGRIFMKISLFL